MALVFQIAIRPEPLDRVAKGFAGIGLGEAEFADGFGGIEKHFVFGHANAGDWRFGRATRYF